MITGFTNCGAAHRLQHRRRQFFKVVFAQQAFLEATFVTAAIRWPVAELSEEVACLPRGEIVSPLLRDRIRGHLALAQDAVT